MPASKQNEHKSNKLQYVNKEHLTFKIERLEEGSLLKQEFESAGIASNQVIHLQYRGITDSIAIRTGLSVRERVEKIDKPLKETVPNNAIERASFSLAQIDSKFSQPAEVTEKNASKENLADANAKPTSVVVLSTPSKLPSRIKPPKTPQLTRKKPVLSKSNSSSLFKPKQVEPICHAPLYLGKDILLKKMDPLLDEIDKATREKLIIKPAVSFPGYDRIDGSTSEPTALKILKTKLDERGEKYRTLGSETNGISTFRC